jgi:chemotaxis protein MotB
MNREAWVVFAGLVVAALIGILGVTAWQKREQLASTELQLSNVKRSAEAQAARLAEAWQEVEASRKRAEALAREVASVTNIQQRLESEMRSALQSRDVAISELQGRLTVTILDRILFDSGEATLRPEGTQVLDQVARVLANYTNRPVQVFGHTDNVPIRIKYASNWELSTARAVAAVRNLTEKAGVSPSRLSAVGSGEFQPIASNATAEGRASNRRIALVVLPELFVPSDVGSTNTVSDAASPATNAPAIPPVRPPASTNEPGTNVPVLPDPSEGEDPTSVSEIPEEAPRAAAFHKERTNLSIRSRPLLMFSRLVA